MSGPAVLACSNCDRYGERAAVAADREAGSAARIARRIPLGRAYASLHVRLHDGICLQRLDREPRHGIVGSLRLVSLLLPFGCLALLPFFCLRHDVIASDGPSFLWAPRWPGIAAILLMFFSLLIWFAFALVSEISAPWHGHPPALCCGRSGRLQAGSSACAWPASCLVTGSQKQHGAIAPTSFVPSRESQPSLPWPHAI